MKKKLIIILSSVFLLGLIYLSGSGAYSKYKSMKNDISAYKNNQLAYEEVLAGKSNSNRVLQLTVDDLRNSNNKYIQELEKNKKLLKTAKNKPGDVSVGIDTSIHAADTTIIENKSSFELDTVIRYNEFTKSGIKIKDNKLISSIAINNMQSLYVYTTEEYVNKYKNKLSRFFHLDWKKEDVDRYDIINTNDLINVNAVIVYKVRE